MRIMEVWKPWTGHWITDDGDVEEVNHGPADIHHSDIALDHFGDYIDTNEEGEHDDYSRDAAIEIAMNSGWVRTSMRDTEFTISYHADTVRKPTLKILYEIVRDEPEWQNYWINDTKYQFKKEALRAIRQDIQKAPA